MVPKAISDYIRQYLCWFEGYNDDLLLTLDEPELDELEDMIKHSSMFYHTFVGILFDRKGWKKEGVLVNNANATFDMSFKYKNDDVVVSLGSEDSAFTICFATEFHEYHVLNGEPLFHDGMVKVIENFERLQSGG